MEMHLTWYVGSPLNVLTMTVAVWSDKVGHYMVLLRRRTEITNQIIVLNYQKMASIQISNFTFITVPFFSSFDGTLSFFFTLIDYTCAVFLLLTEKPSVCFWARTPLLLRFHELTYSYNCNTI